MSCAETVRKWDPYLVAAARLGHVTCVRYLVEQCNANLEEVGLVFSHNSQISGATPIWAAILGDHSDVVKYLVSNGANVNGFTYSKSTPLGLACSKGNLDVVKILIQNGADIEKAECQGITCMMLASFNGHAEVVQYLLDVGANLKRRKRDGRTALHEGVHSGCLDVVKVLLDHNAEMNADFWGETPLITACALGHEHIVKHVLSRPGLISKQDEISALELLGTTLVEKRQDMASAMKYWKLAMHERSVHGILIEREEKQTLYNQYFKEMTTPQKLQESQGNRDAMNTHSMLVKIRVLGPVHNSTVDTMLNYGAEYVANGQLKRCIVLWMHGLEAIQRIVDALNPRRFFFLMALIEVLLNQVLRLSSPSINIQYFEDFSNLFENCIEEIKISILMMDKIREANKTVNFYYLNRIIPAAMHVMLLLTKLKPILSSVQLDRVKEAVHKLVQLNPRDSKGLSLVHWACSAAFFCHLDDPAIISFPSLEVLNILLEAEANPCARDFNGDTPLHTLAQYRKIPGDMLEALLAAGAHLDTRNAHGHSFESLVASKGQKLHQIVNPVRHTSLQCLAASTIRGHGIPYKGVLHGQLSRFVDFH